MYNILLQFRRIRTDEEEVVTISFQPLRQEMKLLDYIDITALINVKLLIHFLFVNVEITSLTGYSILF